MKFMPTRLVLVALSATFVLAGCGSADPDTIPTKENTIRMGGGEMTSVSASANRKLSEPSYLPDWAPVYPGAELKEKALVSKNWFVVNRITSYETNDPIEEVIKFYDEYYVLHDVKPSGTFASKNGKIYMFSVHHNYQDTLHVQNIRFGSGDSATDIVIGQSASR